MPVAGWIDQANTWRASRHSNSPIWEKFVHVEGLGWDMRGWGMVGGGRERKNNLPWSCAVPLMDIGKQSKLFFIPYLTVSSFRHS